MVNHFVKHYKVCAKIIDAATPAIPIWVDFLGNDERAAAVVSSYCKITMTH